MNMIHQTNALRLLGGNHFPRQAKLMRHTFAAETRQPLRTAIAGQNSQFHFGLAQLGGLTGDANRAGKRQFTAAAQRKSVNHTNGRFSHRLQQMENALAVQRKLFAIHRSLHRQFADIRARHKGFFARARQNQHAHAGVIVRIE